MSAASINEDQIIDALRQLPREKWRDVAKFIASLKAAGDGATTSQSPIHTAKDVAQSELVGIWADRTDIDDSQAFARRLRERAGVRGEARDAKVF